MTGAPEPASLLHALARPLLFRMDAEMAHHVAMSSLAQVSRFPRVRACLESSRVMDPRLRVHAFGLTFENPLGIAAGLDKDALAIPALAALGFGHVEIGTVTPRPQSGNAKPRVFRLVEDGAVINRMGFPSAGARVVAERLAALGPRPCIVGGNVGRNRDTDNSRAADDCADVARALAGVCDYLVVNVSSPNTAGLRELQVPASLATLVERVRMAAGSVPVLVKLAPDLDDDSLAACIDASLAAGASGLVLGNTTVSRPASLRSRTHVGEAGGLSGMPLLPRTLQLVGFARRHAGPDVAIIGAGGVSSAEDASRLLDAGATLVQVYTAFIYAGPSLARDILRKLVPAPPSTRLQDPPR